MATKRPEPEEIVVKLRQVEVLMGQGMPRIDAIRRGWAVAQSAVRPDRVVVDAPLFDQD